MAEFKDMWHGIYPAVLTPFNEDLSIDYEMFKKSILAQVDAGVKGIVVAGSLGEFSTLSDEEIFDLVKFSKKHLPSDIPVITNLGKSSTEEAKKFAKSIQNIGGDGLMLLPPLKYQATDREVVQFFADIAESTDLPIMLYNNPINYGIRVSMDMFDELKKYDNIQAAKESTRDLTNVTRMVNRFGDRFKILGGVDTISLETQFLGGHGYIAGLVNAFPHETVAIFKLADSGKFKEAVDLYRWFMPLLELDITPQLVQYIKQAATTVGLSTSHVRPPRQPLPEAEIKRAQKIIDDSIASRPDLPELD